MTASIFDLINPSNQIPASSVSGTDNVQVNHSGVLEQATVNQLASAINNPTTQIANATNTDAGTLTGNEYLTLSRGSGILQKNLNGVGQWSIQTYKGFLQAGTGAVSRTSQSKLGDTISTRDFGSVGDGSTSDTAAIQAGITANPNGVMGVPKLIHSVSNLGNPNTNLKGQGSGAALQGTSGYTISLGYATNFNWNHCALEDLIIDGKVGAANGIDFGTNYGQQLAGRWTVNRVSIQNSVVGISKPFGNIGNTFKDITVTQNQIGYKAIGINSPLMHAGNDTFEGGEFDNNTIAAVYIDSDVEGSGGTSFRNTIFEYNTGFGVYVNNWADSFTPLLFDNVWFEQNATASSVTINGATVAPNELYLANTQRASIVNGVLPGTKLVNSRLTIRDSFMTADKPSLVADNTSIVMADGMHTDGGVHPIMVNSIVAAKRALGNFAFTSWTKPRTTKTFDWQGATVVQSLDFASADSYAFGGTASVGGTTQSDGVIFDSCVQLSVPAGYTLLPSQVNMTSGLWYVFTLDIMSVSGNLANFAISYAYNQAAVPGFQSLIKQGEWRTVACVGQATATGTVALYMQNTDPSVTQVLRLSALQFVSFTTERQAVEFFNAGVYLQTNTRKRRIQSLQSPQTGTWNVGDYCENTIPATGSPIGWYCTVAGTPGTWVAGPNL